MDLRNQRQVSYSLDLLIISEETAPIDDQLDSFLQNFDSWKTSLSRNATKGDVRDTAPEGESENLLKELDNYLEKIKTDDVHTEGDVDKMLEEATALSLADPSLSTVEIPDVSGSIFSFDAKTLRQARAHAS